MKGKIDILNFTSVSSCFPNLFRVTRPFSFRRSYAQNPTGPVYWLQEAVTLWLRRQVPLSRTISFLSALESPLCTGSTEWPKEKRNGSRKNNVWAIHMIVFFLPEILWAGDTTRCLTPSPLFWSLGCHFLKKDFPDHQFYIATHPCPNPDPLCFFSRATVHTHRHTDTTWMPVPWGNGFGGVWSLLYSQFLESCLAQEKHSINTCRINGGIQVHKQCA